MPQLDLTVGDNESSSFGWRLRRLAYLVEVISMKTTPRWGSGLYPFRQLIDVEGELTIIWNSQEDCDACRALAEIEWAKLDATADAGGYDVTHEVYKHA